MQSIFTPKNRIFISRDDAISDGKTRYFTGKPCKKGHTVQRFVANRCCVDCLAISRKKFAMHNPDAANESSARYKASDKGKAAQKKANDKYLAKNARKARLAWESLPL